VATSVPDAKTATHPRMETAGATTQQRSMNRPPLVRGKGSACAEVVEFIRLTIHWTPILGYNSAHFLHPLAFHFSILMQAVNVG
jgi:hypothetical protein